MVAWNSALSPSSPVCSDGLTVDTTPPVFEGVIIPGARVGAGLAYGMDERVWLIGSDRSRVLVEDDTTEQCRNRATFLPDETLSTFPIAPGVTRSVYS